MTVLLWREFVLTNGNASGVVRDHTLADLAFHVQWFGNPKKLGAALKRGMFLATRRGGALAYPHWDETITGAYANDKAERRRRWREQKERQRGEGDSSPMSGGHPRDVSEENGDQGRKESNGPPPQPPQGGGGAGADRLEWFRAKYPKGLVKVGWAEQFLGALSPEEWDHLRYSLESEAGSKYWRKFKRPPDPEKWLRETLWMRVKLPKPKPAPPVPSEAEVAAAKEAADKAAASKALWQRRAQLRQQAVAQGVTGPKIEEWIDQQIASEVPQ